MLPPKLFLGCLGCLVVSNCIRLCVKTALGNNFGPWEVPKLENLYFHFHAFLVGALPKVQNCFRNQFSHKVIYNYHSNFFWSVSSYKMALQKMDFPLYF